MSVKRYTFVELAHIRQMGTEAFVDAADYDALAVKLQTAEEALHEIKMDAAHGLAIDHDASKALARIITRATRAIRPTTKTVVCIGCDEPVNEQMSYCKACEDKHVRLAAEAPTNPTHQHAPTCEKLRGLDCTCVPTPLASLPYPWCRQPSVCRGTCPMDPNCGE